VTEFGKIDDPVDAPFKAWPEEPSGLGEKSLALAMAFTGLIFPPAKILQILKDQFASPNRFGRVEFLLNGFRLGLKRLESEAAADRDRLKAIAERLETPQLTEAVSIACEEAARSSSELKIKQLAAVLVGVLRGSEWADPKEDVGAMIRDISQLGVRDLEALTILRTVHAAAIAHTPNFHDPNAFSGETATLMCQADAAGFHRDDFLSACERLRGFGLAAEVQRNNSRMAQEEFCYRPTRRGLAVLDYLADVGGVAAR